MKRILLILLIVVAVLSSLSVASAGLLDILNGQTQDNVVEIDNITFNTTDPINFEFIEYNESTHHKLYVDDRMVGYTVYIYDFSQFNDSQWDSQLAELENFTSSVDIQNVSGVDIFKLPVEGGQNDGQMRYGTCVINDDLNTFVIMYSPDPNETVKMASTLKFK